VIRRLPIAFALLLAVGLSGCAAPRGHAHQRTAFDAPAMARTPGGVTGAVTPAGPFDEALVSWDVRVPSGSAARLEARVARAGVWSDWMALAVRGDPSLLPPPLRTSGQDRVDVDLLLCRPPAEQLEWRVITAGPGPVETRSVWATTTRSGAGGPLSAHEPAAFAHPVPHRSQRDGGDHLAGRLCSPTAIAMVLGARGVDIGVADMAARVYDAEFDLYGNWLNNTLAACELGVPMHTTRIADWAEAESFLRRGPIVVSLRAFRADELDGAGYTSDSGHLIVLRGFDGRGGMLVRDPAFDDPDAADRVYRRDQLTRLWLLDKKGTAYVPAD
jgi:hypothetical protein